MKRENNGSILILVLLVAVAAGMVLASLSKLGLTEKQLNEDALLVIEAKEAAEAVVECGFSQLARRFRTRTSFPVNALSPNSGNPLVLTDEYYGLFQTGTGMMETRVRMPAYPYNPRQTWGTQETELFGGQIPPGQWKFIDGRVPGNEFDPLRDKLVFIREVEVYGKATVENLTDGRRYTSYVQQSLQVRDAPLFAHAIFYNMDMEIAPGPDMDIRGSVHANGRLFIQANSSLDFFKNVSATGRLYHGPHPDIPKSRSYGRVTFPDGFGSQLTMKTGGQWVDSRVSGFQSIANNRWNGNLMAFEHGIQRQNPVAIKDYVPDDPGTGSNELLNHAYQIIQPLRNVNGLSNEEMELERQKFSYKAGLVVHIEVSEVADVVSKMDGDDFDDIDDPDVQEPFFDVKGSGKNPAAQPVTVYRYDYSKNYEEIDFNNDGTPKIDPFNKLDVSDHFLKIKPFRASGSRVKSGLYDQRMSEGINIVEVDVGKLKEAVEGNDKKYWGNAGKAGNNPSALPQNWWNGVVYIQISTQSDPGRADGVVPAEDGWGVKLVNGKKIPNPGFSWTKDLYGTTIATNAPVYVHGHYNADGKSSTGSPTEPDVPDVNQEPPAAIIGDAVTILSTNWDDEDSMRSLGNRRANSFTEVSAAILTGLVPSDKNNWNNYSGGVENFPRFLEDWRTTFRYRGSMVALFESEVATAPWKYGNPIYTAPNRDWGFNSLFAQGYYPPGTPNTRTFRRINYRHLTEDEYLAAASRIANNF